MSDFKKFFRLKASRLYYWACVETIKTKKMNYFISEEFTELLKELEFGDFEFSIKYASPQAILKVDINNNSNIEIVVKNIQPNEQNKMPLLLTINNKEVYKGFDTNLILNNIFKYSRI